MSPAAGHGSPRTPDRRSSSSTLFGAFRSLTGGRFKSPTPPPSASPAAYLATSSRSPSLPALRAESTTSSTIASADASLRRISETVAQKHARPLLGGPPVLHELVLQVDKSHSLAERAAAVDKICAILDGHRVHNVLSLWSVASDLLLPEQPDETAESGYKLLESCVALPQLTAVERSVFFDAALLRKNDRSFDRRLRIISILTKAGRDIEACESSIPPFILTSLDSCFKASRDALNASRKANGKKKAEPPVPESKNVTRLFQFAIDVCRFNSKIFSEDDLELLLKKAMTICHETTQQTDIENAIRLFDTIITYDHVPNNALRPCLEVLCAIHLQLHRLQEQSWNTLSNLFKSHVGQAAVASLLHILLDRPTRRNRQFRVYRGTSQVLQLLLLEDGRNGLPKVPISLLFPALKASVQDEHKTQEDFVINLIDAMLAEESIKEMLLSEADWSSLVDIIYTCAERDDERVRAKSTATTDGTSRDEKPSMRRAMSNTETGSHNAGMGGATPSLHSTTGELDADVISTSDTHAHQPPTIADPVRRYSEDPIFQVMLKLDALTTAMDFVQKAAVMELFMRLAHRLSDSTAENVIRFYSEERYLHPSNGGWLEACRSLVAGFLKDSTRPRSLRITTIRCLRETYEIVEHLCASDAVLQCGTLLLNNIEGEEDVQVLHELVDFAVDVANRASDSSFPDILRLLRRRMERVSVPLSPAVTNHPSWLSTTFHSKANHKLGSPCNVISTAIVRLFIRSISCSARKTRVLYETLRYIVGAEKFESDARLTALKLLFRLRADAGYSLIVSSSSEGESIAAVLCRTEETAVLEKPEDAVYTDPGKAEEVASWREQRKVSSNSPQSSMNRHSSRHTSSNTGRVSKPVPPLWIYPGPKGLPEEPNAESSRVAFSHIDAEHYPLSEDVLDLEVTLWLELVISLLQKSPDWEIYSYVVVHLGPQLSNQSLVRSCVPQLKMLRGVLCEQLRTSSFRDPPSHTLLKKADVAVCLFHILTVLISYNAHFEKSEDDDIVKTFLHGIGNWDRTSKWSIHALSVCCHEMPLSVSKSLDNIVQKMSQIITKPATAIHILEFLTSLARMPELYKNFREDDFKMVFGVSFRYLQHLRDQRDRTNPSSLQGGHRGLRHSGASRDFAASPDQNAKKQKSSAADDLPQYLYSLAYHVITFWFMGLKMDDRPKQIPWITKNLLYTDSHGRQVMEEQGQVILDVMSAVAYSDRDETVRDDNFSKPGDGEVWNKTWIVGHSLVTIETAARTGVSQTTTRRPCGTRYLLVRPLIAPPPHHQVSITHGIASEAYYTSSYVGILPDDIFQTYYAPLNLAEPPIPLPDDDMTRRAISTFDRNATVDSYKVGVVYIGEGQTNEREILLNDIGSPAYTSFLGDLGTLCRLKGAKFNTGGLDTRDDQDGEFTYCWRDRCIELVFHITTMMPSNPNDDMTYPNKKRHIGNDTVNIIFNDSGLPYNFDTFPSAFNYVHIVISPESRASFANRRLDSDPDGKERYYKVQVISRPGFPDISPAAETKILCGKHLAAYCRLIAINASVFSQVWIMKDGGESISSWRNRLREIKRLRERYGANDHHHQGHHPATAGAPSPSSNNYQGGGGVGGGSAGASVGGGLSAPPSRDANGAQPFKRTSVATFLTEGTSRSSVSSGSHDVAL